MKQDYKSQMINYVWPIEGDQEKKIRKQENQMNTHRYLKTIPPK